MVTGSAVSYVAIGWYQIYGLLIGELTVHLVAVGLLYTQLRHADRRAAG